MSRIGAKPIKISPEVQIKSDHQSISVTGPQGSLTVPLPKGIGLHQEAGQISLACLSNEPSFKALHGLTRSLLQNAVQGVVNPFQKKLELVGTGYRVKAQAQGLTLTLGYSHSIEFKPVPGIELTIEGNNIIFIKGIDKQLVGQVAANIRALRPPEPYKGKGIRYSDEIVRRKPGKAAKTTEGQ